MTPQILDALAAIEREHAVRVLFAAESGSRAWGFASPDSDYDVRFVYVHARDWYLRLSEPRDVIEQMLPDDLDVSGWDLRKALRLFARSNVALYEWLGSPIVYREDPAFAAPARALIARHFQPAAAMHHYLGTARTTFHEHLAGETVRLKKVFYFLRPILACRWIEHARSQPPTAFAELVAAGWVDDAERTAIAALQQRKQLASEADREALDPALAQWMRDQLEHYAHVGPSLARRVDGSLDELDALMAALCTG
ncbi:nucleotidyltransferase domain-containing protein [Tahibacter caeni]|uniref:nucleotidyltransferase domain-containing protein n=1 Tax=Tahibacter caeni TaxID=1453545 RepID=UPI002147ACC5|nr:nucleotidyltransferase domain-containing protein [Tahibacter caeni]